MPLCRRCNERPTGSTKAKFCEKCRRGPQALRKITIKKEKFDVFHDRVEAFRQESNTEQPHCISDKIFLYLRYAFDDIDKYFTESEYGIKENPFSAEERQKLREATIQVYELVRGDPEYTCFNTRCVAAAILYIGTVMSELYIKQEDIASFFQVAVVSIRNPYKKMLKEFFDTVWDKNQNKWVQQTKFPFKCERCKYSFKTEGERDIHTPCIAYISPKVELARNLKQQGV